jgi:hypothetical protein
MKIIFQMPDIRMSMHMPLLKQLFPNKDDSILQSALQDADFDLKGAAEIVVAGGKLMSFGINVNLSPIIYDI